VCVRVCVRDYFIIPSKVVQKSEGEKRGLFLSLSLSLSLSLFHTNHNERVLSFDAFFSILIFNEKKKRDIVYDRVEE